jgi:hemerythrin-like domain-containing protein
MTKIAHYLDQDHQRCDEKYAVAERDVAGHDWPSATENFDQFLNLFERHLEKEERILFPRLEHAIGNAYGPSIVMRSEHKLMRGLIQQMRSAIWHQDSEEFFAKADVLYIMLRQHNLKEENLLYPQADRVLQDQAAQIVAGMQQLDAEAEAGSMA